VYKRQDKPRAILRELSTNALDAHIAAGKADVPFEVILPTNWESTLIVRDWGTGLSPEQIESLYTTYFGSNKTHTNDLVGGLGLGSKSPFAYTDQFTAVSRYNGTKYTYAAFIGASNVPEITLVGKEDTDEGNGFEVHVPVKEVDVSTFQSTAKRVFEFFDVKPKTNIDMSYRSYADPVMTLDVDGIMCSLYADQDHSMVMQGPIGYPIDKWSVTADIGDYRKSNKVEQFLEKGWRLFAPVGTFEITASREALSYDKATIAKLIDVTNKALAMIKAEATDKLIDCKTVKEASELMIASNKYLPSSVSLEGTEWNGMKWNRGFVAPLPPNTELRLIKKRPGYYRSSSDPHTTDIMHNEVTLTNHKYRIYYAEKSRPFKAFIAANPAEDKERILYFTGPPGNLKAWLESVGLPAATEMPKLAKLPAGTVPKAVNYGATRYYGIEMNSTRTLKATANEIIAESNCKFMLTDSVHTTKEEFNTLKKLGCAPADDTDFYAFDVHRSHNKVRKGLMAQKHFIADHEALLKLCSPINEIYDAVAKVEAQKKAFGLVDKYVNVKQAVDVTALTEPGFVEVITMINEISKSNSSTSSVEALKHRLKPFVDLDFEGLYYTSKVKSLYDEQVKDLQVPLTLYGPLLSSVVKAHSDAASWRYTDSTLQKIVTEWGNAQAERLMKTTVVNIATPKTEVA